MQRSIPDGRYLSSLVVALSATLAACGGGATDASSVVSNSEPSVTQSASTSANATTSAAAGGGEAVQDTAVAGATSKAIEVPNVDPDAGSTVVATAETTAPSIGVVATATIQSAVLPPSSGPVASPPAFPGQGTRSGVGLNLSALSYYSGEIPTIDVMKRASPWMTQCNGTVGCSNFGVGAGTWDTLEEAALDLDGSGYPRTLPAASDTTVKYRKVTTALSANGMLPEGRYIVRYDGAGTLAYGGFVSKQASLSSAGRDVVDLKGGSNSSFWLTIVATTPGNYLRNIRVYLPGGACASDLRAFAADATSCGGTKGAFVPFESFPATNIWNPQFLADVQGFRTLRFMDWGATNNNLLESWSARPLMTNRSWSGNNGVPIEAMLDLANTVTADPWINLPAHANDDYVLQFARLASQKLAPSLKVNLEYANEPWNYAFPATKWMLAQAQAAWPDEVAKGTNIYTLESNWYARRLVQACGIAKNSSSDAASRFRCISNTQAAQPVQTDQVLACVIAAKTLGQACAKSIDVVSVAPYFGYYLGLPAQSATLVSWAASPDGGLDKVFQELTGHDAAGKSIVAPLAATASNAPSGAMAQATSWMTGTRAVATKYGLPMWAYEGGQHLVPPNPDPNSTINNLMIAANRDARMQGAYEQMIASWQSAGGQVFAYFNHAALPSKSGSWGMKENMSDNNNAKWKAALEKRNSACWWSGC
ncbi:MAG: hypothetical protein M3N82_00870 [Pseudomonadota bacterium]|nr:hypothetical protein [Pseudomonadota bacterium]